MQFHLTFNKPNKHWPNGVWSLYHINGDEIARRVVFGPDGRAIERHGWPGFIGCYGSIEEVSEAMKNYKEYSDQLDKTGYRYDFPNWLRDRKSSRS